MPRSKIEQIREKVKLRQYDMTVHAVEEMAEDDLDIIDVEQAVSPAVLRGSKEMIREEASMWLREQLQTV